MVKLCTHKMFIIKFLVKFMRFLDKTISRLASVILENMYINLAGKVSNAYVEVFKKSNKTKVK